MQNVAIFGGTFDPIHWGHLLMAETALIQAELEQVIWVPTRHPPHKSLPSEQRFEQRQAMLSRAIASQSAFVLAPTKTHQNQPDYAIETLLDLQEKFSDRHWYWIIGLDAFQTLPRWYQRDRLVPACEWLVAPRLTTTTMSSQQDDQKWQQAIKEQIQRQRLHLNTLTSPTQDAQCHQIAQQLATQNIPLRWQLLKMHPVEISSSLIRSRCRDGKSIRHLVPETVRDYILACHLYNC
jgi:nicotinate-nucleotide adenylyltransferase